MEVYRLLDYDGVAVGPLDLAGGPDLLQESREAGFPWLSANLFSPDGSLLFPRLIRKKSGETEIFITAVSTAPRQNVEGVVIKPWQSVLPSLINEIKGNNRDAFVVLLSNLSDTENRRIVEQVPGIHLLIGGDQAKGNITPKLFSNTLLAQTEKQGKSQGLIEIRFGKQRQWGKDSTRELAELQNRMGSLNWQLKRLEKKASQGAKDEKLAAALGRLHKEKTELETAISSTRERVATEEKEGPTYDLYSGRIIALKSSLPDDQNTESMLDDLRQRIREIHSNRKTAAVQKGMLGNNGCAACHEEQTQFWKRTRHAGAYDTLVEQEKNLDLNCLPCHLTMDLQDTTLATRPRPELLAYPPELQGVGCESCHGAGQMHSENPEQVRLKRRPEKELCLTCHSDERDDDFDYEVQLPQIACPAG